MSIHQIAAGQPAPIIASTAAFTSNFRWEHQSHYLALVADGVVVFKMPVEDMQPFRDISVHRLETEMRGKPYFTADVIVSALAFLRTNEMELQEWTDANIKEGEVARKQARITRAQVGTMPRLP